jgi:dihydroorotate dehydrogenase
VGRSIVLSTLGLAVVALVSGFGLGMSIIGISGIALGVDAWASLTAGVGPGAAAVSLGARLPLLAAFVAWAITSELTFVIGFRMLLRR